ncbi:hypothetical protein [Treponema sp. R6D11]
MKNQLKKQNVFLSFLFSILFLSTFLSCEELPINRSSGQSWLISNSDETEKTWTTLTILSVQVDKSGGWDSVEKETAALAPLYFWDSGCAVVAAEREPSYAAQIQIREREYNTGWKTKKSLAVEVRIWEYKDVPENNGTHYAQKLPAATGRIVASGDKSFSSSETTGRLLSKAIDKAVKELFAYERKKDA